MGKKKLVSHHVVPNSESGWDIKRSGSKRTSGHSQLKSNAEKLAREISKNQKTELVIHGKDGEIQRKDSDGNDPLPPWDKK